MDAVTPDDLISWRKRLNLTQEAAAEKLGCGRRSLQQWEAGIHDIPKYIGLACSALALGIIEYPSAHE